MSKIAVNLTAKWQLDAALLSRPVDLTALVTMSRSHPNKFTEDDTLRRLVKLLLNEKNANKSDKDTKLDVLNILANVATGSKEAVAEVRAALQGVSEWFDEYIVSEESAPGQEPELHKAMVLLLARCWDYKLKTEDVLELTRGDRRVALCTVVGLLEDGETYSTELKQRQKPGAGKMGQWEHELVYQRYEKPLLLQICRLLRGFTHPGTYFECTNDSTELALFSVEKFAEEMDALLDITLRSRLVEKLSVALYDCLFEVEDTLAEQDDPDRSGELTYSLLEESDHMAVVSVHAFLQNLYFYASENNAEFRRHMLMDTLLIPRLILPYLDRCVLHATILNSRAEAYSDILEGDRIAEMALHCPQLVKGIAASLRTLIIASFRAPATQFVMSLLRRLNPTAQMLRATAFCRHNEYIFALLCLLNVNMGALDMGGQSDSDDASTDAQYALYLLQDLAAVFTLMDKETQSRVNKRVMSSGALPISRDTPSYAAVMAILQGGVGGQSEYVQGGSFADTNDGGALDASMEVGNKEEDEHVRESRAEVKRAHADRMAQIGISSSNTSSPAQAESKGDRGDRGVNVEDGPDSNSTSGGNTGSDSKSSHNENKASFDSKDVRRSGNGVGSGTAAASKDKEKGYRLLGDLPSLSARQDKEQIKVALSLELPGESNGKPVKKLLSSTAPSSTSNDLTKGGIPSEFICAINGHVMKEPVRAKTSGLTFERATIELWLSTRGSICPISNSPLTKDDLEGAEDLRNRIKRYHIQQTSLRTTSMPEDDLYDF